MYQICSVCSSGMRSRISISDSTVEIKRPRRWNLRNDGKLNESDRNAGQWRRAADSHNEVASGRLLTC